jgi:drug/metabolite transporter (DMT)-like permease
MSWIHSNSAFTRESPSRAKVVAAFAAIYIVWGSTFLAMRFAVATIPPLYMAGTRHLVAGILLYPIIRLRSREKPTGANWLAAFFLGGLLLFIGNGAVAWSEQTVPSGVAALLVATVSLWMVFIEWLRPGGQRPSARVIAGIALGFTGMVFLVGPGNLFGNAAAGSRVNPAGSAILLGGSLCWAFGSVYTRHVRLPRNPLLGAAMQSLAGGVLLCTFGTMTGEARAFHWSQISTGSALAVGYLVVFGSLLGFSAYTWLLRTVPPSRVSTYAFVNPVVAMILGWAFAGERISMRTLTAAAIILAGVVIVITAPHRSSTPPQAEEAVPADATVETENVQA